LHKKASSPCSPSFGLALPFLDACRARLSSDAGVRPRVARFDFGIDAAAKEKAQARELAPVFISTSRITNLEG